MQSSSPSEALVASDPRVPNRPIQMAVVGVSPSSVCGVRDHAVLLADALAGENVSCSLHWLWREGGSMRAARAEIRAWTRALASELDATKPDAVLLHYSIFAYSYRGLPLFVHPALSALRRPRTPLITVLHEFAYPWLHGGWRGNVWAMAQRAVLIEVMRDSAAALVTTDFRAQWLRSRPWLPRRRVIFAPVFSNLPPPRSLKRPERSHPVIGVFGYSYEGAEASLLLDAIRELDGQGVVVRLMLLGAPGPSSPAAKAWLQAARSRGLAQPLSFSGTLPAQELSDALAGCDVLVSAFSSGPTSRKGSLAAALASGRPVITTDGPRGWSELIESRAVEVVKPTAPSLAGAIGALLADEARREALGARGREFAEQRMGVARTANALTGVLRDVVAQRR